MKKLFYIYRKTLLYIWKKKKISVFLEFHPNLFEKI